MMVPSSPERQVPGRELRLDMFRGLALVMIFINHVPGTVYEHWTSRNFGFSDAAEAFVFMSGMAAGLAYSSPFATGAPWSGMLRIWARTRKIYLVHLAMSAAGAAIFIAPALMLDLPSLLERNNMTTLVESPLAALAGIVTLGYQLGYLNILPLYVVLLAAAPLMIWVGWRWPFRLVAASVLVWALAGIGGVNFPNFPDQGVWFFNPFAWQLMFAVGLACGIAMKSGRPLVAYNAVVFWLAAIFLVGVALWMQFPAIGAGGRSVLGYFSALGVPGHLVWFDKADLALPRALHAFALFYVLSAIPWFIDASRSRYARPLVVLGQHALPVFATGTLIALGLQVVKTAVTPGPWGDGLLLCAGLALQLGLAFGLAARRAGRASATGLRMETPG